MSSTQLRQKELKLKRWEEDLCLKEKLVNEHEKDHTKLSYIAKLENKHHENSLHIQTLQTRIEQLECQPARKANDYQFSHYKNTDNNQRTAGNIHLMNSIQDRVRDRPFNLKGGGWCYGFLFRSEFFFRTTRELEYLFFFLRKVRNFFPEFHIRLYDKNSESDYFFFLHQNQNIFFSNIGNQNIFLEKKP